MGRTTRQAPTSGGVRDAALLVFGALVLTACAETTVASARPSAQTTPEPVLVSTTTTTGFPCV